MGRIWSEFFSFLKKYQNEITVIYRELKSEKNSWKKCI